MSPLAFVAGTLSQVETPVHLKPLLGGFKRLYASKDFSDLTITCQGREWQVHKSLVCAQSAFFQAALAGEFKEAKEGKINLNDDEPQVVEALIYYFYNHDYAELVNGFMDVPPIIVDVKIYAIADKTFVEPLKILAAQKFAARAAREWDTNAFVDAVTEAYACTSSDEEALRKIIVAKVIEHKRDLLDRKQHGAFGKVLRETELGAEVAIAEASPLYLCSGCREPWYAIIDAGGIFPCPHDCSRREGGDWGLYIMR